MGGIRVRPGPIFRVGCSAAAASTGLPLVVIDKVATAAITVDVMSKYAHVLVRTRQVPGLVMDFPIFWRSPEQRGAPRIVPARRGEAPDKY